MSMGDKSNVNITPPSNGVQYRKSEVVNELRKYEKGSKEIGTASNVGAQDIIWYKVGSRYGLIDI